MSGITDTRMITSHWTPLRGTVSKNRPRAGIWTTASSISQDRAHAPIKCLLENMPISSGDRVSDLQSMADTSCTVTSVANAMVEAVGRSQILNASMNMSRVETPTYVPRLSISQLSPPANKLSSGSLGGLFIMEASGG